MKLSDDTVRKVAKVARLDLTDDEIRKFRRDLSDVLESFKVLDEAPVGEPSFQPLNIENVSREDVPEKCLEQAVALKNTKHKEKGFFKGPRAI